MSFQPIDAHWCYRGFKKDWATIFDDIGEHGKWVCPNIFRKNLNHWWFMMFSITIAINWAILHFFSTNSVYQSLLVDYILHHYVIPHDILHDIPIIFPLYPLYFPLYRLDSNYIPTIFQWSSEYIRCIPHYIPLDCHSICDIPIISS